MHRIYYDLRDDIINRVYLQFCSGTPFEEIMKKNCLTRYEVLAILRDKNISKKYLYDNLGPRIDTEKFLVISDTHLGSEDENLDYIKDAYMFAENFGIEHVLHGGDLLHSDLNGVKEELRNPHSQIEHVINNYPEHKNITTHILLGNHDFNLLVRTFNDDELLNELRNRKDFDILGFKKAYLKWFKLLISIRHSMGGYYMPVRDIKSNISFTGHYHMFRQNYPCINDFSIPTLSDEYKLSKKPDNLPGFITLERKGKTFLVHHYSIDVDNKFEDLPDIKVSDRKIVDHGIVYQASMEKKLKK